MRKKYKQPKRSKTTAWALPDLYGQKKTKKKKQKGKKKPLKAEVDPWAQLERDQLEAKKFEEARKAIEGLPTPTTYGSYEEAYLAGNPYGHDEEEHLAAKYKDAKKKRVKMGPPSMEQMMAGARQAMESPESVVKLQQQANPLGMAMYFEQVSKENPSGWEYLKGIYPSVAGKHQKDKEAAKMQGMRESTQNIDQIMQIQRDAAAIGNIQSQMMGAKTGMAMGGKKKYNMAGMLPGAIQGVMGTAAMANQGNFTDLPWQHQAGRIMQGASGVANLIPGAGPLVGMGLNLVGGALQTMGGPAMTDPTRMNTNPMGLALGGNMPGATPGPQGGSFQGLSNEAMEVQANNPTMTDSVDAGQVMLDDKEVVVGDKVFSNTLRNPQTGMTFAEQEKETQKKQGQFEKYKNHTGDTEMKDDKYHKRNSAQLFNAQENIANVLGLRNQDGTPVQKMGAPSGMWAGGSLSFGKSGTQGPPFVKGGGSFVSSDMRYATGGKMYNTGGPLPDDLHTIQTIQNSLLGATTGYIAPDTGTAYTAETGLPDPLGEAAQAERTAFQNTVLPPTPPRFPGDTYGGPQNSINPLTGTMPGSLRSNELATVTPGPLNPTSNLQAPTVTSSAYNNAPTLAPPTGAQEDPEITVNGATGSGQPGTNMQNLLEAFKGQNPYGERATQLGEMISGLGLAANRPFYVNYGDVGREEINQQNLALAGAQGGEQAAINDINAQLAAARGAAGGRSFQTMQANLANLATRGGETMAKVRGQFGRQEAGLRTQIGARRTGIEQANFNIDRYQDDINTREYDSLWKENLKNMTNLRNMQLERQFAFNNFRRDNELSQLLKTQDFEYGPNGELVFKQRKANIAGRTGDKTNNATAAGPASAATNTTGNRVVSPGLQNFSYLNTGLANAQVGAASGPFAQQYANPVLGFDPRYNFGILGKNR